MGVSKTSRDGEIEHPNLDGVRMMVSTSGVHSAVNASTVLARSIVWQMDAFVSLSITNGSRDPSEAPTRSKKSGLAVRTSGGSPRSTAASLEMNRGAPIADP
jgi:hypothetical protein